MGSSTPTARMPSSSSAILSGSKYVRGFLPWTILRIGKVGWLGWGVSVTVPPVCIGWDAAMLPRPGSPSRVLAPLVGGRANHLHPGLQRQYLFGAGRFLPRAESHVAGRIQVLPASVADDAPLLVGVVAADATAGPARIAHAMDIPTAVPPARIAGRTRGIQHAEHLLEGFGCRAMVLCHDGPCNALKHVIRARQQCGGVAHRLSDNRVEVQALDGASLAGAVDAKVAHGHGNGHRGEVSRHLLLLETERPSFQAVWRLQGQEATRRAAQRRTTAPIHPSTCGIHRSDQGGGTGHTANRAIPRGNHKR